MSLPFAPVRPWLGDLTLDGLAELCRVNDRTVSHWAAEGVNLWTADLIACRLGLHPYSIWGEAWEQQADRAVLAAIMGERMGRDPAQLVLL